MTPEGIPKHRSVGGFPAQLLAGRAIAAIAGGIFAVAIAGAAHAQVPVTFSKSFSPSTIGPGSASTLTFSIASTSPSPVTSLAFTDSLPAGMVLATPAKAATTCTNGSVVAADGGATVSLSGGQVAASSSCTVTVNVTSGTVGTHTNVSGDLTSSAGNSGPATAALVVDATRPGFSKGFSPGTISIGGVSRLTFVIDNSAGAAALFGLNFSDTLPTGMVVATPSNASTDCGNPSFPVTLNAVSGSGVVTLNAFGLNPGFPVLAAAATCSVGVDVTAPAAGLLGNVSGELTVTPAAGGSVSSGRASAVLEVVRNFLVKAFTDDPLAPGGTGNLRFTLSNFDRASAANGIAFTDDLGATLPGLVAVGLPLNDACGPGSTLSGTGVLSLTGGNLPPEGTCTIDVAVQVPAGATAGTYPNTTSTVTATIGGVGVTGLAATDSLVVAPAPRLTKTFIDDPVIPGEPVTLRFTIVNTDASGPATAIAFADVFSFLPPPVGVTPPAAGFCGPGASMTATGLGLSVTGGSLGAGASCTFDALVTIPSGFPAGVYTNTTGPITATVGAATLAGSPATDNLQVVAGPRLTKLFAGDPVGPGATVTLQYTLSSSPNTTADATAIAFTDDLDAALVGLVATGLPLNDVCGTGSQVSGTAVVTFTGGTLAPGSTCTFAVTLSVPAAAAPGSYTSTTSVVSATVLGKAATESGASDVLDISALKLLKAFTDDPVNPGATVTLEFTASNVTPASAGTGITFTDDLNALVPGLVAVGLPANDVCGAGSQIAGTGLLTLTGGALAGQASCTFSVTLQVPPGAAPGEYRNTTSAITGTVGGSPATGQAAADTLFIASLLPDLTASKSNTAGGAITLGGSWDWRSTVGNGGAAAANFADGQTIYVDTMPRVNVAYGAPSIGASTGVTGTINCALVGGNVVTCLASGAVSIAAAGSFRVDVTATPSAAGTFTNPTGGPASVDPFSVVAESNETNNGSNVDSVVVALPTYGVTYDGNGSTGGSVPVDGNAYVTGATVNVLGNTGGLVRTGFAFTGWNTAADGSGTAYAGGATFTMGSAGVVLYAQWGATFGVTYDGNASTGGTVPVDGNAYLAGAAVTVAGNTGGLVRAGFTFTGWNTAADGSGTAYAGGVTFPMGSANVILYAQWTALPTYTVTYDGNGNTGGAVPVDGNAYLAGATVTVAGNTGGLVRAGFAFAGWNTAADGSGTNYAGGATFAMGAANVVLYAQWTLLPTYTVTYNGNGNTGGTVPVDGNAYLAGATVTVAGNTGGLVRAGFAFAGWNTAADGSGTAYAATGSATFAMGGANVTLYARWTNSSFAGSSPTGTGTITASFTSADPGCAFTVSQFIPVSGHPASPPAGTAPAGIAFPHGLFDFQVAGCNAPGATVVFTITYPQPLLPGTQYFKYGPTPGGGANSTPHWYVLPATISGNTATFSITDGGLGDDDLVANGTIVDQGGPGSPSAVTGIPTLGEWALALLALLMLGAGVRGAGRPGRRAA